MASDRLGKGGKVAASKLRMVCSYYFILLICYAEINKEKSSLPLGEGGGQIMPSIRPIDSRRN